MRSGRNGALLFLSSNLLINLSEELVDLDLLHLMSLDNETPKSTMSRELLPLSQASIRFSPRLRHPLSSLSSTTTTARRQDFPWHITINSS
jgi:hypothetical protein